MNTTQLECFLAVANHLNFSRAAQQLCITQPAVSHQINTLEDELGAKLFFRTSKSVRLTQEGHLFLQYAGEILKLTGLSKARVRECRDFAPQRLGIGCRNTLDLRLVEPVLAQLRQEFPQLLPVLRLIPSAALDQLEENDIQAILSLEISPPHNTVFRSLIRCPMVCVCRKDHPLAAYDQLTPDQLQGRLASCPPSSYPPALLSVQNQLLAGRSLEELLFCDTLEVALTLIGAGCAFAVLPDVVPARRPDLAYIPMPQFDPIAFGVLLPSGQRSPLLRRFLTLLEALLTGRGGDLSP